LWRGLLGPFQACSTLLVHRRLRGQVGDRLWTCVVADFIRILSLYIYVFLRIYVYIVSMGFREVYAMPNIRACFNALLHIAKDVVCVTLDTTKGHLATTPTCKAGHTPMKD
jgi:hypothetical protein